MEVRFLSTAPEMSLFFVTGNEMKYSEMAELIPNLKQLDLDLPEIQEIDPKKIVKEKLSEAFTQSKLKGQFIIDDTSLVFEALGNLPGPLIKWFLKGLGLKGIADLVAKLNDTRAQATAIIGYASDPQKIQFFEGTLKGDIVSPRGAGFGWDPIFQPEGSSLTFAEMGQTEKNRISHRSKAATKLVEYLKAYG